MAEPVQSTSVEETGLITKVRPISEEVAPKNDCSSELSKYDWNQQDAYKVMYQESSNNPLTVNDNPATGDYSIGCFQINIRGNLAQTRPSKEWLQNPMNNVSYAYQMYVNQGRTFCKTSGWYNTCKKLNMI